ncbi:MAG TPA: trypsin-like peptidase domain-containing protein [Jatrophihabitans sp.]|uniref:S1C family serine protease n=1 Tax=Jatrophihabitans sp. TaxID=1932789 RepID=UPI002F1D6FD4
MSDQSTPEPTGQTSAPPEQPYYVPTAHQQAWSVAQHYPGQPSWSPPPVAAKPRSRRLLAGSVAAAAVTALTVGGIAVAADRSPLGSEQTTFSSPNSQNPFDQNGDGQTSPYGDAWGGNGSNGTDGNGSDGNGSDGNGSNGTQTTGPATAAQQVGVVNITTTVNYGQGRAAGTGIVLSPDGEVLTNNHVIEGSTAITVTVVSTGKSYSATVVGTAPSEDVSVLQLKDASGLATAKLGDSSEVEVGDAVTAVGNAGGKGGTPTAATGTVTALNQSITASDSSGANTERLTGMIEIDADLESGQSGGPLFDNATDSVIGIDTAASSASGRPDNGATTGYAIPIDRALDLADKIESGEESSTVNIGYPAFLGVQLSPAGSSSQGPGAQIAGVVDGSAAAKAGLRAGDSITAVDGTAITSASGLSSVLDAHEPGDQVRLGYTDSAGQSHSVTVTLGAGPAD